MMGGTIAIIVILVLAPVAMLLGSMLFVVVFTGLLNRDVDHSHQGSELLQLAETGVVN